MRVDQACRHVTLLEIGALVIHSWATEGQVHFCGQRIPLQGPGII